MIKLKQFRKVEEINNNDLEMTVKQVQVPVSTSVGQHQDQNYGREVLELPLHQHAQNLRNYLSIPLETDFQPSQLQHVVTGTGTDDDDLDLDVKSIQDVYISCPGRPMPYRILVIIVGLIQVDLAIFGIYFWAMKKEAYKYFPQMGPIILAPDNEFRYSGLSWLIVELVIGIALILVAYLKVSRWIFTAWSWSILCLTMSSFVYFCWNIPFQYSQNGFDIMTKFLIQTLFHFVLFGIVREHYKQRFHSMDQD